jgi:YfdX protein
MSKPKLKTVAVALLVAGMGPALLSAPLYAAATVQEQVSVTPEKTLTPREEAIISSAGAKVLRHIAQARADIHNMDTDAVKAELDKADKLLDIINEALPASSVKDRIWVAKKHLEYEDTQQVLPDLIPIYSSLDELMDVMPVKAAKAQLDKARKNLEEGDKAGARKALEETDASLQYTEIDLPLSTTRHLVAQARIDVSGKKFDDADKALKAAEDSVVFSSVGIEQPLFAARAALTQSVVDLDAGNNELAKADLQTAIGYLKSAEKSPDAATREAAGDLHGEAQQLLTDMQGGASVSGRLHRLLERTQAYADRAVEYLATGWQRYRAEGHPFKSDLIEARLHLADARIDMFTGRETARAKEELDAANRFLDQAGRSAAKRTADKDYRQPIGDLQQAVKTLGADPASGGVDQYAALQRQLDDLIGTL